MRSKYAMCALLVLAMAGIGCSDGKGPLVFVENFQVNDIRVDTDVPGAAHSDRVRLCSEGLNVYVVWADDRDGNSDIYFNRSSDGGKTWLAADVRLDTDVAGAGVSDDPQICCSGGRLYVSWEDSRDGSRDVYFNRSLDGGQTWLGADVRLDADVAGAADSGDPQIGCSGTTVYVVWEEDRNGLRDVYVRSSADAGATWNAEALVNTNGAGASVSDRPRLSVNGPYAFVVWHDGRNGENDIYFNASLDSGQTWGAADARLDTDVAGAGFSFDPEVHSCGLTVLVAWSDLRSGNGDIFYNRSADGGQTWLAADVRLDTDVAGAGNSIRPQVRCEGTDMYVAWVDQRTGAGDVHMNKSTDGGVTWLPADVRVDTEQTGAGNTDFVQINTVGVNVYVVWEDDRDGERDIRLNYSSDRGDTWQGSDLRCDTNAAGVGDSRLPRIAANGLNVYVVWRDTRNGANNDVYCRTSTP